MALENQISSAKKLVFSLFTLFMTYEKIKRVRCLAFAPCPWAWPACSTTPVRRVISRWRYPASRINRHAIDTVYALKLK
jgi:hypothetical protein